MRHSRGWARKCSPLRCRYPPRAWKPASLFCCAHARETGRDRDGRPGVTNSKRPRNLQHHKFVRMAGIFFNSESRSQNGEVILISCGDLKSRFEGVLMNGREQCGSPAIAEVMGSSSTRMLAIIAEKHSSIGLGSLIRPCLPFDRFVGANGRNKARWQACSVTFATREIWLGPDANQTKNAVVQQYHRHPRPISFTGLFGWDRKPGAV